MAVPKLNPACEDNEVLQFLLGNAASITSEDDSSSVTSTSSGSCHSQSNVYKDTPATDVSAYSALSNKMKMSSPHSASHASRSYVAMTGAPCEELYVATVVSRTGRLPDMEATNQTHVSRQQKPETQPEDEDTSAAPDGSNASLRKRRASGSIRAAKSTSTSPERVESSKNKSKKTKTIDKSAVKTQFHALSRFGEAPSDWLYVAAVLAVLAGYCAAIMYRFFHPIVYELPNVDALFKPWDVTNVTAKFTNPTTIQQLHSTGAVQVEWEIANFPADAIRQGGVEPLEYKLFLDDRQILFEVNYWSVESDNNNTMLSKEMSHRLRPRDLHGLGDHELRLEVTFPIPGSDGELHTLTDETTFSMVAPPSSEPILEITSPRDGTVVRTSAPHSLLLEFEVHNVKKLEVILDAKWRMTQRHFRDGNLLVRGLGFGHHRLVLEAFDDQGVLVATQSTAIEIKEPEM